jgi:hypothetical protein
MKTGSGIRVSINQIPLIVATTTVGSAMRRNELLQQKVIFDNCHGCGLGLEAAGYQSQ